jgi:hypothetical protein
MVYQTVQLWSKVHCEMCPVWAPALGLLT